MIPFVKKSSKVNLALLIGLTFSNSSYSHTDSLGWTIAPVVGSSSLYLVDIFYGTWHNGAVGPEGGLNLVGTAGVAQTQGFNQTQSFSIYSTSNNSSAPLPTGLTLGTNYFYPNTSTVANNDFTGSASRPIYGFQVAQFTSVPEGTYSFGYAAGALSVVWTPSDPAINAGVFTIGSGGTITVVGAPSSSIPNIDVAVSAYTAAQLNAGQVNPAFEGGTLTLSSSGNVSTSFTINGLGGTIDTNGSSNNFTGVLSNLTSSVGGLIKAGLGTLTLSNSNTYSGGTTVSRGTLSISTDANLGASSGVISLSGGTLQTTESITTSRSLIFSTGTSSSLSVDSAKTFELSGSTSGSGAISKAGLGTLVVNGVGTNTGDVAINAGVLKVGLTSSDSTASLGGNIDIAAGASLGGYGTVGSSSKLLSSSGTISPGGSIGTLTVAGNFTQDASGNFLAEIGPTTSDKLVVSGTASLNGTVTVNGIISGDYRPTRYTLLTSSGLSGSFSSLAYTNSYSSLGYFLSYDAYNVYLTLGPDYINTTAALTRNFEQMKSLFASQAGLQISGLNFDCSTFGQNNICLSTGGRTSHVFNKSDAYNGGHPMTTSALLIGAYRLDPTVRVGAWIDQNLNTQNSNIKMSNAKPMLGAFSVYSPSGDSTQWQVKGSASYVEKDLDITRQQLSNTEAGNGKSSFKGLAAQLEVAYGFADILSNAVLSPVAGIRYYSGRANDYTEESTSSVQVPISYNKVREKARMAFAGVKLEGNPVQQFRYNLSAGVETDIKRNNPTYSGTSSMYGLTSFNLQGNSSPRDTRGYASAGASYLIDKTQSINFGFYYRQDQFKKIESVSSAITYTVGL